MKNALVLFSFLASPAFLFAQTSPTVLITDADYANGNECDCSTDFINGSNAHFFDSGGAGSSYGNNEDESITFCPDLATGTKVTVAFGINAGFSWNVDGSDTVYVYDGPTTAAPLLGAHNSVTDPTGFTHQASWANNPSGCLTVRFVSDGAVTAPGWAGNVSCGTAPQPYEPHIYAFINGVNYPDSTNQDLTPADTGYADVCFGDSILFVASGSFPYSLESTGNGYSQNTGNATYEWEFSDGTSATGKEVWFTPPARSGYLVTLRMTDPINWIQQIKAKVRVSTIPSFATAIAVPDTICLGSTSSLVGGVSPSDTAGVSTVVGAFEVGGVFSGLTYLPDGSGQNYTTTVNITDFLPNQVVGPPTDILGMCITMEHSFLGDLEMLLECPNGTQGTIFNSFSGAGEIIPGGFGGGGTYLGDALDNSTNTPGVGWEYCFDSNNPTFGTMGAELTAGNTVPTNISMGQAMNPNGVYDPEDPWTVFAGCPLNGPWTITVRDNLSIDDGYIFEWGLFFDPSINPNTETYKPSIVSEMWLPDPTITTDSDTLIVVTPGSTGDFPYTFEVVDNFGCTYDTTINVHVLEIPEVMADPTACDNTYTFTGNLAPNGGTWNGMPVGHTGTATFNDNTIANPTVTVDNVGPYDFTFTDPTCNLDQTVQIIFIPDPTVALFDAEFCEGDSVTWTAAFTNATYLWSTGETTPVISAYTAGTYSVDVSNECGTASASAEVITDPCAIVIPNVFSPNGDQYNENFVITGLERWPGSELLGKSDLRIL